jgi:hypothetical protein
MPGVMYTTTLLPLSSLDRVRTSPAARMPRQRLDFQETWVFLAAKQRLSAGELMDEDGFTHGSGSDAEMFPNSKGTGRTNHNSRYKISRNPSQVHLARSRSTTHRHAASEISDEEVLDEDCFVHRSGSDIENFTTQDVMEKHSKSYVYAIHD